MESYKLYNGNIELIFDKDKHIYRVGDKIIYGVTSATGILDKPALMYWAVNQAIGFLDKALKPGLVIDELNKPKLLAEAKTIHRKKKDEAADIGTAVHNYLETYIKAKINWEEPPDMPVNEQVKKGIIAFVKWAKENKVQFISSERKVYSKEHEYAGTLDMEAIVNGKLAVVDFKTSKGIYPEYFIQTTAYAKALQEETGNKYKEVWILRIPKDGTDFGYAKNSNLDFYFESFLGCLSNYRRKMWEKANKIEEMKILINNSVKKGV